MSKFWPGLHRQEVGQFDKIKVRAEVCADFWDLHFDTGFGRRLLFCLLPLHPILCILDTKERERERTLKKKQKTLYYSMTHGNRDQLGEA